MERKLAAILAADVVGYSRLMEADEAGTFARLKERRQTVVEPELTKHRGRIFKLMGDGLLAEFASVVDAVECAVAVQRGMAERNINLTPDQRVEMRVGITLGDVKAMTSTAMASTSRRVCKSWPSPAGSSSPRPWSTTWATKWRCSLRPWASSKSRTSPGRSRSIR